MVRREIFVRQLKFRRSPGQVHVRVVGGDGRSDWKVHAHAAVLHEEFQIRLTRAFGVGDFDPEDCKGRGKVQFVNLLEVCVTCLAAV